MWINQLRKQDQIQNGFVTAKRKTLNGSYGSHWHEFFEMELILSGTGVYIIDGRRYVLEAGRLFFMTPVNFHRVEAERAEVYTVMFSASACELRYLTELLSSSCCAFSLSGEDATYLGALLRELVKAQGDQILSFHLLSAVLAKLTVYVKSEKQDCAVCTEATLFVLENFRFNPSLRDAAAVAGLTPTYFSRKFKEQNRVGYKQFLNQLQLEYAKRLLSCTDLSVLEVSVECGFGDYANFVRQFKRRFGVTPTVYRTGASEE